MKRKSKQVRRLSAISSSTRDWHSDTEQRIKLAPEGTTVAVGTETKRAIARCIAERLCRKDLKFEVEKC